MSTHFLNGNTYGPTTDSSPATIIVDPLAIVRSSTSAYALTLKSFPWSVDVKGTVEGYGVAIDLIDTSPTYVSDIRVALGGRVASQTESGIIAGHATNITNAGVISGGAFGIQEGPHGGNYTINNLATGNIYSNKMGLYLRGPGTHEITNAGKIDGSLYSIYAEGPGVEKITNSGRISGPLKLGDGNDIVTNFIGSKSGAMLGQIDLGAGDDTFNGGANLESVLDGAGKDTVKLGGGNDEWTAYLGGNGDGLDFIDGGTGVDTYDAYRSEATNGCVINLDSVTHSGVGGHGVNDFDPTTPGEMILNFENAYGTGFGDYMYGSNGKNELGGNYGKDYLYGLGGQDRLTGGMSADHFVYLALSDSKAGAANRDTIVDFEHGNDVIDLSGVDANSRTSGNQAFKYIGTQAFHKVAGELHYKDLGATCLVQGDVNGDGKADLEILVKAPTLSAHDFVL